MSKVFDIRWECFWWTEAEDEEEAYGVFCEAVELGKVIPLRADVLVSEVRVDEGFEEGAHGLER